MLNTSTHRVIQCDADPVVASYSRTLYSSQGAFPRSVDYANPIQRFDETKSILWQIGVAAALVAFCLLVVFGLLPPHEVMK
jgi:hypothetical protein